MRGLSLVGLLVGFGVVGMLMFQQNQPAETSETSPPTGNIEKANQAAETMEQQAAETVEQQAEQLQQDMQKLP